MSDNVVFGMSSSRNVTFDYTDDSGISKEDWAKMTESERDEALAEYLYKAVDAYVVED